MYGVFDSYEEAKEAQNNLAKALQKNGPRVERITIKQNLYKKYNEKE